MSDEKPFDKKVAKLIREELRHDPENCETEAWKHLHAADASKDPYWKLQEEQESKDEAEQ